MGIKYKKLTENELDIFIDMRNNQLREEGAKEDIDLVPALKDYYNRHMADGTFISWLAFDEDKIIGTSPNYRRKGIAKEYGCGTVQITASDMGVKLYKDFGFVHNGNFMQYKL